jgi:hypothetical protein
MTHFFRRNELPESPYKFEILGLNLLCLLSKNCLSEFHTVRLIGLSVQMKFARLMRTKLTLILGTGAIEPENSPYQHLYQASSFTRTVLDGGQLQQSLPIKRKCTIAKLQLLHGNFAQHHKVPAFGSKRSHLLY